MPRTVLFDWFPSTGQISEWSDEWDGEWDTAWDAGEARRYALLRSPGGDYVIRIRDEEGQRKGQITPNWPYLSHIGRGTRRSRRTAMPKRKKAQRKRLREAWKAQFGRYPRVEALTYGLPLALLPSFKFKPFFALAKAVLLAVIDSSRVAAKEEFEDLLEDLLEDKAALALIPRRSLLTSIKRLEESLAGGFEAYAEEYVRMDVQRGPERLSVPLTEIKFPDFEKGLALAVVRIWCVFGANGIAWASLVRRVGAHDATYWLPRCEDARKPEYDGLAAYLMKYRDTSHNLLRGVVSNWPTLPEEGRRIPPRQLDRYIYERTVQGLWGNAQEPRLLEQAINARIDARDYPEIEARWIESLNGEGSVPFIETHYQHAPYRMRRLSKTEPEGVFLGAITDCCQYPGGEGEDAAWYGQENPYSAFYVIEDVSQEPPRIIAQSWVWICEDANSEKLTLVFDTIESQLNRNQVIAADHPPFRRPTEYTVSDVIRTLYEDTALALILEHGFDEVVTGGEPFPSNWPLLPGDEMCITPSEYPYDSEDEQSLIMNRELADEQWRRDE